MITYAIAYAMQAQPDLPWALLLYGMAGDVLATCVLAFAVIGYADLRKQRIVYLPSEPAISPCPPMNPDDPSDHLSIEQLRKRWAEENEARNRQAGWP